MVGSLSTEEAARRLGCTSATVRRLIGEGVLVATRVQRKSRFSWQVDVASVDAHLNAHGTYGSRQGGVEARLAALERAVSDGTLGGAREPMLATQNAQLRDRVVDLEETLVRTRAAVELTQQADEARRRTIKLLSQAIDANEEADRLRQDAAAQMEEALANFTRSTFGPGVR